MQPESRTEVDAMVEALRAHLDADEQTARAASQGQWVVGRTAYPEGEMYGSHISVMGTKPGQVADMTWSRPSERIANAEHIARNDPDRVLRRVASDRAVLELLLCMPHRACAVGLVVHGSCNCGRDAFVERMARHLAEGYADRDSSDESGRPA